MDAEQTQSELLASDNRSVLYSTEDTHSLVMIDSITGVEQWRSVHPETIWEIALFHGS